MFLIKWAGKELRMPLIEIHLLEGRTDDQKKALLTAVTAAVHESIDAPLESIRVWVQEFSPREYMIAGILAAERKK
jgi:4-oxalocrotonate tautomerase